MPQLNIDDHVQTGAYRAFKVSNHEYGLCLAALDIHDLIGYMGCAKKEARGSIDEAREQGLIIYKDRRDYTVIVSPDTEIMVSPTLRLPLNAYRTTYFSGNSIGEASLQQVRSRLDLVLHRTNPINDRRQLSLWYPEKYAEEIWLKELMPYVREQAALHPVPEDYHRCLVWEGKQAAIKAIRKGLKEDNIDEEHIKHDIDDVMVAWAYLFYYHSNSAKR